MLKNGPPAYPDSINQDNWIATVNNLTSKPFCFTAIDNCVEITKRPLIHTKSLTNAEFAAAIRSASSNSAKTYDLNYYNYMDFAVEVFNATRSAANKLNVLNNNIGTTPAGLYKTLDDLRKGDNINISYVTGKRPGSTNCN